MPSVSPTCLFSTPQKSFLNFSIFIKPQHLLTGKKSQENYKCTKARVNKILRLIGEGLFKKDACLLAGISRETFYQWIRGGKQDAKEGKESLERELYEGLEVAEAKAVMVHVNNIKTAGASDWKASAWWLERTKPNDYGRRQPAHTVSENKDEVIVIG